MSNKKKTDEEQPKKTGLDSFFSSIKHGFENFQGSLEKMAQKNKEQWDQNTDKVSNFFKDMQNNWENQVKKWGQDLEKAKQESDEQWQSQTKKVEQDFLNWQNQIRTDWKDGVREWNRMSTKAYIRFILYLIPILIIIIIVLRLIVPLIPI